MQAYWSSACLHATAFSKDTPLGRRSFTMSALDAAKQGGGLEIPATDGSSSAAADELSDKATFYYDLMQLVSLLHAVAIQELRLDDSLENLVTYDIDDDECNPPIAVDRHLIMKFADRATLSWMERSTGRWFSLRRRCQLVSSQT